jgi:hypothetical protein
MWNINMSQANAESEIKPSRVNKIHSTGLAFGVVFLAGCVCILAFNHRPMFHTSGGIYFSWGAFFAAVCVAVFYIAKGKLDVDPRIPKKRFADSVYYLGFLLTLVSLLVTFMTTKVPDASGTGEVVAAGLIGVEVKKLVAYCGAALTTTVVGLLLRIVHTQFDPTDPREHASGDDADAEIRNDNAAVVAFNEEVTTATVELSSAITECTSHIKRQSELASEAITAAAHSADTYISGQFRVFSQTMNTAARTAAAALRQRIDDETDAALKNSQTNLTLVEEQAEKISAAVAGTTTQLENAVTILTETITEFTATSESKLDDAVRDVDKSLDAAAKKTMNVIAASLRGVIDESKEEIKDARSEIVEEMRSTRTNLNRLSSKVMEKTTKKLAVLDRKASKFSDTAVEAIEKASEFIMRAAKLSTFAGVAVHEMENAEKMAVKFPIDCPLVKETEIA